MQRLHINDLSGYLIKKGNWALLKLPAIFEKEQKFHINNFKYNTKIGDLLNPKRESIKEIQSIKEELGSYAFSGQYQQNPISNSANIFKKKYVKKFSKLLDFDSIYQSWDYAIKVSAQNDFSVCTTWGIAKDAFYLLEVFCKKLEYINLKESMILQYELYNPEAVLIEDKASGQQLLQDLKAYTKMPVISVMPRGNKITRCFNVSHLFESGKIHIPEKANWLHDFELELFSFPDSEHDDQVDSMTQFLIWSKKILNNTFNLRRL